MLIPNVKSRLYTALLGLLLVACAEPDLGPTPAPGDYYPTARGLEWRYLGTGDQPEQGLPVGIHGSSR
jgi:hypothetical protein